MKEYSAKLSHLRQSPQKVQRVARLIRGKEVQEVLRTLAFCDKAPALPLKKLILSALASGGHDSTDIPAGVFVKDLVVGQGPVLKRWMPRAQGRASPIRKKTSHIRITLKEIL
jgi:large subunit ribosomal protein L22